MAAGPVRFSQGLGVTVSEYLASAAFADHKSRYSSTSEWRREQRLLTRLGIQELNKIRELVRVFFVAAEVRGSYLCRLVTQD